MQFQRQMRKGLGKMEEAAIEEEEDKEEVEEDEEGEVRYDDSIDLVSS